MAECPAGPVAVGMKPDLRLVAAPATPVRRAFWNRLRRLIKWTLVALAVVPVFVGQAMFLKLSHDVGSRPARSDTTTVRSGTPTLRASALLADAFGPSDRGVRRFAILSMESGPGPSNHYRIKVEWALNNSISSGSVGNGAQDDVYAALRALFTGHLFLASATLVGTYPSGHTERVVMRLMMGSRTAHAIGRVGWDAVSPQAIWPLVHRIYVAPDVQPIQSE